MSTYFCTFVSCIRCCVICHFVCLKTSKNAALIIGNRENICSHLTGVEKNSISSLYFVEHKLKKMTKKQHHFQSFTELQAFCYILFPISFPPFLHIVCLFLCCLQSNKKTRTRSNSSLSWGLNANHSLSIQRPTQ